MANDYDWESEIGQRTAEDTNVSSISGEKYKATEKDVQEFIDDMNASQKQHAFDPNDWYDWSVAVSKMPYSQMRQDKRFRALAIRTFHFRDKKVDVSGIDYDPSDADELFDESHIVKERFSLPYKGDKKQQLKSRLAAIGVNFPNDNEPTPRLIQRKQRENTIKKTRKTIPLEKAGFGKPYMDRLTSESKYLDKGTPVRPPKPNNKDFGNIISAAREHIKEAKTDFDHQHSIEWRQAQKIKGSQSGHLVEDDKHV